MELEFDKERHRSLANDHESLRKKCGKKGKLNAEDVILALDTLKAANSLFDIPRSFRPHPLKGKAKGKFTIDIDDIHRVVFRPSDKPGKPGFQIDNPKTITSIIIEQIFIQIH